MHPPLLQATARWHLGCTFSTCGAPCLACYFEPNDPPVNRPISIIVRLLLLPVAPLTLPAEALVNRMHMPGPWSGLLMLTSVIVAAFGWSFLLFLARRFWKRICTKPGAPPNGGLATQLGNSGGTGSPPSVS